MSAFECPLCNGAPLAERDALRARVAELEAENGAYRIREELGLNTSDLLTRATQAEADARRLRAAMRSLETMAPAKRYALTGGQDSLAGAFNAGVNAALDIAKAALAGKEGP